MDTKIIAMVHQKGGVGKTTSTMNLGVGLARQGHKVLLVDSDPQGSLTISMGIQDPDSLSHTLATAMLAEIHDMELPTGSAIIPHKEGPDLLPANIELSGVEMGLFNAMSRETIMRNVLGQVKYKYDYILIDCMPSLGLMTINALAAADSVIIPSQPNYLSSKGLNLLLRSVAKVRKQINPKLRIDGGLFTMVDSRTNNAKAIISSMRGAMGDAVRVFRTEIPRSVRAAEAAQEGKSIYAYDKNGRVAEAYAALTKEVSQLGKETNRFRSDGAR